MASATALRFRVVMEHRDGDECSPYSMRRALVTAAALAGGGSTAAHFTGSSSCRGGE